MVGAIVVVVVLAAGGLFNTVRSLVSSGPSGKLLGATVVEDAQGRSVLWMLVDEGFYMLTTISSPGHKSTGDRCYLFCHCTVFAMDLKSGDVLLRDTMENSGSPGTKAALAAAGNDVWAVLQAVDDRAALARHYDGAKVALAQDTAALVASNKELSAGLIDAEVSGANVELSTKDGRKVTLPMSTEPASGAPGRPLPFFLIAESRANKARLKLYRLAGADELDKLEVSRLSTSVGLAHGASLDKVQRNLDRYIEKRARNEGRPVDTRGHQERRSKARRADIADLRAKAAKAARISDAMRLQLEAIADKMEAEAKEAEAAEAAEAGAPPADDAAKKDAAKEDVAKEDKGLRMESLAGDRVFLEAWVAAHDAEYLFIIHQQVAGKRSARLLSCVDGKGEVRWTLQAEQLPDVMARDDAEHPFSSATMLQWRMAIERYGDAVILMLKPHDVRVYDLGTGELRLALDV